MRNFFILFATIFTMTTNIITIAFYFIPSAIDFKPEHIFINAFLSILIASYILLAQKIPLEIPILFMTLDVFVIFILVVITGYLSGFIPARLENLPLVFILVVIIYTVITLIYYFILKEETKVVNTQIKNWRNRNVND